ncbi:GNAT family N-acetyltransferase [Adhaeribacter radiodurans]|uniref:GNAT family N-acetyltransferase n=1 Tax=Adhaeribacter radiodurans TaxID=2745197 RepID=A0A7L7L9B2_9BACT|nr:GNAT family N-acetyltransferase [Adhaeribacter radiodurans]QMU29426.1 GNAT family N-acetyltransferase [Adhaeribacter radiodurans]
MIVVRRVTDIRDLDAAFTIREKVFVEEQKVPQDAEYDQHDKTANHYLATYNEIPVGAARWRPTTNGIKLERFAVLPAYRNKQVGSALLHEVLKDVLANFPDEKIYLHAQVPALSFYARHGFTKLGELFTECDIDHFKMVYSA